MAKLEEVFNRIKDSKKEQREIRAIYKDALVTSKEYIDVVEKLDEIKSKKKKVEEDIRSQFSSEFSKLESLKLDIASDNELLSDIALNQLMKGETVKVTDEYENDYEPIFSVRFKKA
jgi:DNA polymerase III delta prime subunit